jgi:hypothetical protein
MIRRHSIVLIASLLLALSAGCSGPSDADDAASPKAAAADEVAANSVVHMDAAAQQRIGLVVQSAEIQTLKQELKAYGRLQEDPTLDFVVRAPISGVVHAPASGTWPTIGMQLSAAATVGGLEPRYSPTDRINLSDRLITARAAVRSATAAVDAADAAYERTRLLNADNKNVSDRALQEAAARLETEKANLDAAKEMAAVVESSTGAVDPASFTPLIVERSGEVTEVLAQPGEDVAVGAPLVRVVSFDSLLANIVLPVGESVPANVRSARIVPAGHEDVSIPATLVAVNASVDPAIQGQSLLLRLSPGRERLRPGQAVTAYLDIPGERARAIVIPPSAVVRHTGESFAYVRQSDDEFSRRRLLGLSLTPGGYAVEGGLSEGEDVVVTGAQLLLSEELKYQIDAGDNE